MKSYYLKCFRKTIGCLIFFTAFFSNETDFLFAQETYLNELEIDSSTKLNNNSDLPTNPFEIVEMIRRANSMNDATNPSDAIDDALKSFEMTNEKDKP